MTLSQIDYIKFCNCSLRVLSGRKVECETLKLSLNQLLKECGGELNIIKTNDRACKKRIREIAERLHYLQIERSFDHEVD